MNTEIKELEELVSVRLIGDEVTAFRASQDNSGIRSKTDFIRFLINSYYKSNCKQA